ncbi:MAG: hypothetical protein ACJ779_00340 [Chloroflexota bacterium]
MTAGAPDRIRAFAADAIGGPRLPAGAGRLVAVGWATVETERAVHELGSALGRGEDAFRSAASSAALGCTCVIARAPLPNDVALIIVEPEAEGRIAAALARWDEGPVVAWYAVASRPRPAFAGAPGPLGPERLVRGDPLTGPHRLLVADGAGTIRA